MANVLDISIKSLFKEKDPTKILDEFVIIEEKLDGVKVQVYLKKDASPEKDFSENWIVSYKGNVLYPEEFYSENPENSIGYHQFYFIFEKLKKINSNIDKLPKGTQFFFEYLIKKPTLMSNYIKLYNLILLGFVSCNCFERNGLMKCDNNEFKINRILREKYAKIMNVFTPPEIFKGYLYPTDNFLKGLKINLDKEIENALRKFEKDKLTYLKILTNYLLSIESKFGNEPEGFVIISDKGIYKFQKPTQLDKNERMKIKLKYAMDPENEEKYWNFVKETAKELYKKSIDKDVRTSLKNLSNFLKKLDISKIHTKKTIQSIKDDIYLNAKFDILNKFAPDTGLIIGKFRILHKKHYELIKKALKENEFVIIALSLGKGLSSKSVKDLRKRMIENCFKNDLNRIEILFTSNGFIPRILLNAINGIGVNKIYAGSDRIDGYKEQIKNFSKQIKVIELERNDDISATNILKNIFNKEYFKENTPKCVWDFREEIIKVYNLKK